MNERIALYCMLGVMVAAAAPPTAPAAPTRATPIPGRRPENGARIVKRSR